MKIPNCHDCGERPEFTGQVDKGEAAGWFCQCEIPAFDSVGIYPTETWTAIQRRKRQRMRFELLCAAQSWEAGIQPHETYWEWAEDRLLDLFGPADGVEVGDD